MSKSVRKGGHQTLPGVQHSDYEKTKATNTGTVEAVRKGSQMSILHRVQHIDCDRDELCELFLCEVNDVNNDKYNDISPMESGVASLPNLSTIEEEPSVLHDDSSWRQTSQEPSSSHETAKSPDEEPSVLHDSTDELHANSLLSNSDDTIEDEIKPGPLRKFLKVEEMLYILEGPIFTLQEIPVGRKDGMYFIIDDTINVERRKNNNQSQYWDDCGVWRYSSTPPTPFVFRNDKWRSLRLRRGIYCKLKNKNKQAEYIPLDPQPQPDYVVKLHRLYQKLQDKSSNGKKLFRGR